MSRNSDLVLDFLKKYWYYVVMLIMAITIYVLYKRTIQPPTPPAPDNKAIERLRESVDSLGHVLDSMKTVYDNKQSTIINNITYQNAQNAKNISDIPNFTLHQRDSMWAKVLTTKDSVPRGYWDILKSKTRK
jgi:hypothetical protein